MRVLPLLSLLSLSTAIFPDQLGLFEHTRRHIGPVISVSGAGKTVAVRTAANVLAALTTKTGEQKFRTVLADGKRPPWSEGLPNRPMC